MTSPRRRFSTRAAGFLAGAALAGSALSVLGQTHPVAALADGPSRTVPGTEFPGRDVSARDGDLSDAQPIEVAVTLPWRNEPGLRHLIADISDPNSASYRHYLTDAAFQSQFAPTADQLRSVASYLTSAGLNVTRVSPARSLIDASGTASAMRQAFGTQLGRYHDVKTGRSFYANDSPVRVPSSLAPLVAAVVGLSDHYPVRHAPIPHVTPQPLGSYGPDQLKTGYDVTPLGPTFTGGGQQVGLFELDQFASSDVAAYDSYYYSGQTLPPVQVQTVDGGCNPCDQKNGPLEVDLDIEVIRAIAPQTHIVVWEGPNNGINGNTDAGVIDTYDHMINPSGGEPARSYSNSTSWGSCEPQTSQSLKNAEDSAFMQAAALGMSFYSASGDSGSADCGGNSGAAVDNPADDPYMTGAGGTRLNLASDNTWQSETAWSNSGGGVSADYAQPSYQSQLSTCGTLASGREVPDVASDGDPSTGVSVREGGTWQQVGGTSAAAPSWAAATAIFNQALQSKTGTTQTLGLAGPALYPLGLYQQFAQYLQPHAFHDITVGNNGAYSAGPGYDMVTGLGSYDANNLVNDLLPPANDFTLGLTQSAISAAEGSVVTMHVNIGVPGGSSNQTVTLMTSGLPAGVSASFNPPTVTGAGSSTLSLTVGTDSRLGNCSFSVLGFGSSATHDVAATIDIFVGPGVYHSVTPFRVFDSRGGNLCVQCAGGSFGPGSSRDIAIAGNPSGNGNVAPAATAVVVNLTGVQGSANTFIQLSPTGSGGVGATSNLNLPAGTNQANLVTVAIGAGGKVTVFNSAGTIDVVMDVEGYFTPQASPAPSGTAGTFHPIPPLRLCDTRAGHNTPCAGGADQPLAQTPRAVTVWGSPAPSCAASPTTVPCAGGGAAAVVFNLTGTGASTGTFLEAYPTNSSHTCGLPPNASNVNLPAGVDRPNRVIVPIDQTNGAVCIFNSAGSVNFIIDVNGWFGDGTESSSGALFYPVSPIRLCDTRSSEAPNQCSGETVTTGGTLPHVNLTSGLSSAGVTTTPVAAAVNATGVDDPAATFLTLYPDGSSLPNASDLNVPGGTAFPNLDVVKLGSSGDIDVYNAQGAIDVILDLEGWFAP